MKFVVAGPGYGKSSKNWETISFLKVDEFVFQCSSVCVWGGGGGRGLEAGKNEMAHKTNLTKLRLQSDRDIYSLLRLILSIFRNSIEIF